MIFLTGSTGFVGRNLVPALKEKNFQVRCFIRRDSNADCIGPYCEDKVIGDILDEASLRYALRGMHTVIHLAGVRTEMGSASFEGTFYLGTRHVVDVARAAGIRHFILFSACGASPASKSHFNHYKWLGEEYLRHSGLKYTILRPTIIYGPHDHFVTRWIQILKKFPVLPIFGKRHHMLQPVAVDDIVRCVLAVLEDPSKQGTVHELGGPERFTLEEVVRMIGHVIGRRRVLLNLPMVLAKPFSYLTEFLLSHPPLTPDEVVRWMENVQCDLQNIENKFGFRPENFGDGLRHYFSEEP